MKKLAAFLVLAALCLSCSVPAVAQRHAVNTAQSRASRKMERKQQKAQRKYAKAQRKAQRKMEKQSRKNTHYPNRRF